MRGAFVKTARVVDQGSLAAAVQARSPPVVAHIGVSVLTRKSAGSVPIRLRSPFPP